MLEGLKRREREAVCGLMKRAATLSKEDFAIFKEALEDSNWPSNSLANALTERQFVVGEGMIRKHRTKLCRCAT